MNSLTPEEVEGILRQAPAGATVYLVGAGGCGMSGLGHLLLDAGFRVAGSDLVANDEISQLRARGADIALGHAAGRIEALQPVLAVYTSAVRRENVELQASERLRIPTVRRAVLLAALMRHGRGVCVAGMHGKTTTTALLAFALERLGAKPSYAVGASVPQLPRQARLIECGATAPFCLPAKVSVSGLCISTEGHGGQSGAAAPHSQHFPGWFVAEADESDGTLHEFHPEHAVLLNIDAEHLDFYAGLDAIGREFQQFASQTRGDVIFCADDPRLAELLVRQRRAVSYGFHALATYRLETEPMGGPGGGTRFAVWVKGERLGRFATQLIGEKNVSNCGAVIALLHRIGYSPEEIRDAIEPFTGAARRQQVLFCDDRFRVVDDYGHHPAEIRATLEAMRSLRPRRMLVAFQPHRYTRTRDLLQEFGGAFNQADRLWLMGIYPASEPPIPGVDASVLAGVIRRHGPAAEVITDRDELCRSIRAAMVPGDLVVCMGAGADITRVAHALASELSMEGPDVNELCFAELVGRLGTDTVLRRKEPLKRRTTLRVGGDADVYVEPSSESELASVLEICARHGIRWTMLGRGSNLLIRDGGIRGVVISLAHPSFSRVEVVGDTMNCGAGASLKTVAVEARQHGLAGLEFLEGIPGSVGGAMRMNAGAMGSWMFDVIDRIRFMDRSGMAHERPAGEVTVEYRGCPMLKDQIALGATLKGRLESADTIRERVEAFNRKRWESQPKQPSAGCIFKNPKAIPAGRLIDELGLKGTRVGGARVSEVHGNFIVNDGDATARDVLNLIEIVRERARSARGIELETEVEILGEER